MHKGGQINYYYFFLGGGGGGGGGHEVGLVGGGQGGCELRSVAFVKIQKKKMWGGGDQGGYVNGEVKLL